MLSASKAGGDFNRLMAGEDICGDHSRSDFRLMSMLAFATAGDREQMTRIFESSGLYRPEPGLSASLWGGGHSKDFHRRPDAGRDGGADRLREGR